MEIVDVNIDEYQKQYDELMRVSWDNKVLLPIVLGSMPDPKSDVLKLSNIEYTLEKDEKITELTKKRDEGVNYLLADLDMERAYRNMMKFEVDEVKKFLKKYPQFKKVFIFEKVED